MAAFTGVGIRFDEVHFQQRQPLALHRARLFEIARQTEPRQLRHFRGNFVRRDGNDSAPAHGRNRKRQRVVTGKHEKIFRHLLDHLRDLGNASGGFLHADNVLDFGKAANASAGSMFTLVRGGTLYRMIGSEIAAAMALKWW